MKTLFIVMLVGCCQYAAAATPHGEVINSCLKTESTPSTRYAEIPSANFTVEEDADAHLTSITLGHRGHTFGAWESTKSGDFGLTYDSTHVPINNIVVVGTDKPSRFTPLTAQWGEAIHGKNRYLCITFNFSGLGESGSFQNIRGLYLINMRKPPKFYYTVGDIRAIKD